MTAIIYVIRKDSVSIAMDTLVTGDDDKKPCGYLSKIFPVPHLNGVICGTGVFRFVVEWFSFVNSSLIVKNMIHLDQFAPGEMNKLFAKYRDDEELIQPVSTIYHFGYEPRLNEFVGFVYRSEENFKSEIIKSGYFEFKPPLSKDSNEKIPDLDNLPGDFIEIMKMQKKRDDELPLAIRLGIGGDIHFFHMCKNPDSEDGLPILMQIQHCHRFSDYEDMYLQMIKNISK